MNIRQKDNKIYFTNSHAEAIIELNDTFIEINLIKVECEFRHCGYCKDLIKNIIHYIEEKHDNLQKIVLSPLPLDPNGLDLSSLIKLYSKYKFHRVNNAPKHSPYLMERKI